MKIVKVAIIDTGIDTNCDYLLNVSKTGFGLQMDNDPAVIKCYEDKNGHGTACASVIYRECNNVEYVIVNALGKRGKTNALAIEETLKCIKGSDIDVVSMSFAIPYLSDNELQKVCSELVRENKILVASYFNKYSTRGFPAEFENVYGVSARNLEGNRRFVTESIERKQYVVNSTLQMSATLHNKFQMVPLNNSLATAKFTGIICDMISKNNIERTNYKMISDFLKGEEKEGSIRKYNGCNEWYIEDGNELLVRVYKLLSERLELFKSSDNICDFELLTSRGKIKFNDVYQILVLLEEKLHIKIDYMKIDRYDLLTVGTLTKCLSSMKG